MGVVSREKLVSRCFKTISDRHHARWIIQGSSKDHPCVAIYETSAAYYYSASQQHQVVRFSGHNKMQMREAYVLNSGAQDPPHFLLRTSPKMILKCQLLSGFKQKAQETYFEVLPWMFVESFGGN